MFFNGSQVLDIGLTKVHNTLRSLKSSYSTSGTYCTYTSLYIQHLVC
jgi:hypothetical protein